MKEYSIFTLQATQIMLAKGETLPIFGISPVNEVNGQSIALKLSSAKDVSALGYTNPVLDCLEQEVEKNGNETDNDDAKGHYNCRTSSHPINVGNSLYYFHLNHCGNEVGNFPYQSYLYAEQCRYNAYHYGDCFINFRELESQNFDRARNGDSA
mmetsp:Transcript_21614/g.38604  ORF Transcript_21614/g.38604 Transcript_21614/m.38604 type:complete len:154 (-) Transcript_21614:2537-2998(-)|eukprot:CAMPEP_0175085104 /NCGR_PEP_ID=MMETSP0052_2-20121109/28461_1 /TAXON_ID=51329 ORGANISM="Polytomella parva, Strain SAG 63-3" /NCGR_SAMPLE_ID=MMETSP0052_2 /ASSEMBLY_ACC=CAM_ASM_000194 /LENGTH=153 /DNA_ID=CAMNT_0016357045 /DNA_START=1084 /DNA_END=1545 /DNA_ORIENTATION=+